MLGMLINTNMPWAPNTWKIWVDHIVSKREVYGFKKAALVHANGAIASASRGFLFQAQEILNLAKYFDGDVKKESLVLQGKTYIIKSKTASQMIAFNGSKYMIIHRSKSMYIISLCESRAKCEEAAHWQSRLNARLLQKDY